jgi:molybdate transport system ATP-binding protein
VSVHAAFTLARGSFALDFRAELQPGSVVAVLGPNGAGKTTLLRTLAGLDRIDSGTIAINGTLVDDAGSTFVPSRRRSVGVVFQDYALFPHLKVVDNVAFGPRARGMGRSAARTAARAELDRLGIADLAERRPGEISGGQAQRVALARALATSPDVLLLDEPLGALDVETRDSVRVELERQLASYGGCAVLVTHDPLDAMLLADRVLVLEDGAVVQDGPPAELARRPLTAYVAALMGVNLLRGIADDGTLALDGGGALRIASHGVRGRALAVIRPEAITVHLHQPEGSARNAWPGTVSALVPMHDRVRVHVDGTPSVVATVTPDAIAELRLARGTQVWLSVKAVELDAYATPAH